MPHVKSAPRGMVGTAHRLTVRGTVTAAGHTLSHVQYLTEAFVITEFGRTMTLHSDDLGGRFVVDRANRTLRPVDPATQKIQIQHLREIVGEVSVHRDPEPVRLHGYSCRRYRVCNDSPRLVVSAEACCARVEAVGMTALHRERQFEATLHPFALPLDPDELIISSDTRTYANGFQHLQSYRYESLTPEIDDLGAIERFLEFAIAGP